MVNVPQVERRSVAGRTLAVLAAVAVILFVLTIFIIYNISHNFYVSAYYTVSSLFDAIGINVVPILEASAPPFSANFDALILISVVDGIAKIVAIGLALAAIVEMLTGTTILSKVSQFAARRLKDHVIICGYSRMAERLFADLSDKKIRFVVIDNDPETVDVLRNNGHIVIKGDYADEEVLKSAEIDRARAVVFAQKKDLENLIGVITARHLNKKVKILSRVANEDLMVKMQRAGAELCVVPEILAGVDIGSNIRSRM